MKNKWERIYKEELSSYRWLPSIVMEDFLSTLRKNEARRILDLGCGIGRNALFLAKEGYFVTGIDISYTALQVAAEKAREQKINNVVFLNADIDSLPFPSGHFDAVFSINVIHHGRMQEINQRVNEIFRVLNKDGIGMVTIASTKDYKYAKGREIEKNTYELFEGEHKEAGIPHHFFDESECKLLFRGFRINELKHIEEPVEGGRNCHWYVIFTKERKR